MPSIAELNEVYDKNRGAMIAYARSRLPKEIPAEDLVQDVYIKTADRIDHVTNLPAYLWKSLRNGVIGEIRKCAREGRSVHDISRPLDPAREFEVNEERSALREAIAELAPRHRRLLSLLGEGLTAREIAEQIGTPINGVSCGLLRAKHALRRAMKHKGWAPAFVPLSLVRVRAFVGEMFARSSVEQVCVVCLIGLMGLAGLTSQPDQPELPEVHSHQADSGDGDLHQGERARQWEAEPRTQPEVSRTASTTTPRAKSMLHVDLGNGGSAYVREEKGDGSPSVLEQIGKLGKDPSGIPLPECGGLPICRAP